MPRAFLAVVLWGACSTSGAGPPGPRVDADAGADPLIPASCDDAEVELGWGYLDFMAVSDGDTVPLYRGSQGGWHIFLAVRARGMVPDDVSVEYVYRFAASGEEFGHDTWNVRLGVDVGDGWHERLGIQAAVFDSYWTSSYLIRGQDARVDATITDNLSGCQAQDGWNVHIAEDPGT